MSAESPTNPTGDPGRSASPKSLVRRLLGAGSPTSAEVLVIGLGRFGSALALSLTEMGHTVLAVDSSADVVQRLSGVLTHVLTADATSEDALRQLGAGDFDKAVVAIGTDIEASVLCTAALSDLGVPTIWAKAVTIAHARILERVGAHRVVLPEVDMGKRVAHLVGGRMLDYVALDDHFSIVETAAPKPLLGRSLAEADVRRRYGVTVVCIKPSGGVFTHTTAETLVGAGDLLVVAGPRAETEAFSEL